MLIVNLFTSFRNKGGAEDVAISLAKGLAEGEKPVVLQMDNAVHDTYAAEHVDIQKLTIGNVKRLHKEGAIFLSHHRKVTTLLVAWSKMLFFGKLRIVHVAHNTFNSLKYLTLFPKYNVAVSNTVKENMSSYFGVNADKVEVIYNGMQDKYIPATPEAPKEVSKTNVLFLGRIVPVKQQLEFVKHTKGKLTDNVKIYFAGVGPDLEALKAEIKGDPHYESLDLINPYTELYHYDYVSLFSQKEGLPLSLIEAEMFCRPMVTNDIPQACEVNVGGVTGFVNHSWEEITNCLNTLPHRDSKDYNEMSRQARANYERMFDYNVMIYNYKRYLESINW